MKQQKKNKLQQQYDAVVVLSGGLDSAVLAAKLHSEGKRIILVYIDYGKSVSSMEKLSAKKISLSVGAPLEIIDVSGLAYLQQLYDTKGGGSGGELDVK